MVYEHLPTQRLDHSCIDYPTLIPRHTLISQSFPIALLQVCRLIYLEAEPILAKWCKEPIKIVIFLPRVRRPIWAQRVMLRKIIFSETSLHDTLSMSHTDVGWHNPSLRLPMRPLEKSFVWRCAEWYAKGGRGPLMSGEQQVVELGVRLQHWDQLTRPEDLLKSVYDAKAIVRRTSKRAAEEGRVVLKARLLDPIPASIWAEVASYELRMSMRLPHGSPVRNPDIIQPHE